MDNTYPIPGRVSGVLNPILQRATLFSLDLDTEAISLLSSLSKFEVPSVLTLRIAASEELYKDT